MIMKYAIEEKYYSTNSNDFGLSNDIITFLASKHIIEIYGDRIKFTYVGFITYEEKILFVAPKVYDEEDINYELVKKVRKVLKKSCRNNDDIGTDFIQSKQNNNYYGEIAIADYLINDYLYNGGYKKLVSKTEKSLERADDWKETINSVIPFFSDGYPVYSETYSKVFSDDKESEIVQLYYNIIYYFLSKYSLLLGYEGIVISKNISVPSPFLDKRKQKYYFNMINNELSNTFKDRDIRVLKALRYLFKKESFYNQKNLSLYGTIKFDKVWEKCLQSVFDDESNDYVQYLPNPIWKIAGGTPVTNELNQMETDIVHRVDDSLLLMDAKYYSIKLTNSSVVGNPGSYDIVKQYVYQLALENGTTMPVSVNALVFPIKKIKNDIEYSIFGSVSLPLFKCKDILCIYYSVDYLFNRYISGKKYTNEEYSTLINSVNFFRSEYNK